MTGISVPKSDGRLSAPVSGLDGPTHEIILCLISIRSGFEEEDPGKTLADQTAAQGSNADQSVDAANCSSGGKGDRNENAKGVGPCSWR